MIDRQPVPYAEGNHCIFYAVQAASMYFNKEPLTLKDRLQYQREIAEYNSRLTENDFGTLLTLEIILSKLRPRRIIPTKLIAIRDDRLHYLNLLEQANVQYQAFEDSMSFRPPVMVFTEPPVEDVPDRLPHVWFVPSRVSWVTQKRKHMRDEDYLVLMMELDRDKK
jgi:hypothetical protein